ncbi:Fe(3+)-hydroxamate ABC transporter permease FhuB [Utexia brackfieldae]|uniref:Fe(3+)-hydroxamate ABC transporter permease FhuB n=1 Tax=Utexia brackfieldae TaxID=3074108 RepID=UPI00370D81F3
MINSLSPVQKLSRLNLLLFILTMAAISVVLYLEIKLQSPLISSSSRDASLLQLIITQQIAPRFIMALLVGGALGLSTIILQQITHNPLAADTTLGISGGAYFMLLVVTLFFPQLLMWVDASFIALVGALVTLVIVLSLSYRKQFLSTRMLLAGLVLNLYFGAFAAALVIFYPESAKNILQWEAGSLVQDSWRDVYHLGLVTMLSIVIILPLIRSLHIMQLDDNQARSLGVPVKLVRMVCLLVLSYLCATAISLVGMIGFIGLAAASMINQFKLEQAKYKLIFGFTTAALLLLLTDCVLIIIQYVSGYYLPVGTVTAFIGTPLLLYLIFRALPVQIQWQPAQAVGTGFKTNRLSYRHILWMALLLVILITVSLGISNSANGFIWTGFPADLIAIKLPRLLTAVGCGAMLSLSGVLLQRLTHNPLASPELLGISAGAAIGVIVAFLLLSLSLEMIWLFGLAGAILTFIFISLINYRHQFQPEKVILTGIAISALLSALLRLFLTSGDPRIQALLVWLSGSTYASSLSGGLLSCLFAGLFLLLILLLSRMLTLFLLSDTIASSLGLNVSIARILFIIIAAALITVATLQIGPLSFIGLLAPLLTRLLGIHEIKKQLISASLIGSCLMLLADWIGRNLLFPYEIPAGLVATLIGGSCFFLLMRRI